VKCKYCERELADNFDYETIPEGEGEHLCWRTYGEKCVDAETALANARAKIASIEKQVVELREAWIDALAALDGDGVPFDRTAFRAACHRAIDCAKGGV
jgi:hypothetical protein